MMYATPIATQRIYPRTEIAAQSRYQFLFCQFQLPLSFDQRAYPMFRKPEIPAGAWAMGEASSMQGEGNGVCQRGTSAKRPCPDWSE
jgi:hypothetical protein